MIPASRFLVQQRDYEAWKLRRMQGVTATEVRDAATPAGFKTVKAKRGTESGFYLSAEMAFGQEVEAQIMQTAHHEFGVLPNDWLISAAEDDRFMATPDGLSLDHRQIAEVKTTGKGWKTIPLSYKRQVQWQLFVTGAEQCLFLWNLRVDEGDGFRLGWWEPKHEWIDRDKHMISDLKDVAERLLDGEIRSTQAA